MTQNGKFTIDGDLHLLKHPFYQAWMEGRLSRHTLQDYARQYYQHVEAFPSYLANAIGVCSDAGAREILSQNLAEEDGSAYGTSHPELWLRFAEGLGVSRADVKSAGARPGIRGVVDAFTSLSSANLPQALGAIYAYESQVPEVAHSKIQGLREHFDIHDERTLSFFEVHKSADVEHRESLLRLIEALPQEQKAQAKASADRACRALWDFLTDVHSEKACA